MADLSSDRAEKFLLWLVEKKKAWRVLQGKRLGREVSLAEPVFNMSRHILEHFRRDCLAASIPLKDDSGRIVDFHCLRHTTASLLSRAKVAPRAAQARLRHSDIRQTMKTYTHPELVDRTAAAETFPVFTMDREVENDEVKLSLTCLLTYMLKKSGSAGPEKAEPDRERQARPFRRRPANPYKKGL